MGLKLKKIILFVLLSVSINCWTVVYAMQPNNTITNEWVYRYTILNENSATLNAKLGWEYNLSEYGADFNFQIPLIIRKDDIKKIECDGIPLKYSWSLEALKNKGGTGYVMKNIESRSEIFALYTTQNPVYEINCEVEISLWNITDTFLSQTRTIIPFKKRYGFGSGLNERTKIERFDHFYYYITVPDDYKIIDYEPKYGYIKERSSDTTANWGYGTFEEKSTSIPNPIIFRVLYEKPLKTLIIHFILDMVKSIFFWVITLIITASVAIKKTKIK